MIGKLVRWIALLVLFCLLFSLLLVVFTRFVDPPTWAWKIQRDVSPPAGYPATVQHRWVELSQISTAMQLAVIAGEDQTFPDHFGIDIASTKQALADVVSGERFRGASTLTQQTAKNVFLWPQQSLFRKAVELVLAVELELIWGKRRILEVYLNVAEFGPGLYGVDAAARHYWGIDAAQISTAQAARLAAVLPSPYKYSVTTDSAFMVERRAWIRRQMRQLGEVTLQQVDR
ncbi:monofunctional biosynthetic peptidoglycan transglycosylase [Sinobacterium caligoides]|uniref:Biosynthetic peptidoglycan transglycosylase n=1 Tax=Sinobacterium caligoides TaxID=933926 RepID=A0A3N2DRG7_9GAMM|nr:monofunctional biosynthetic peptidoglycan transglycosylase [Sinobacterium caligoides]ROS01895.1 monofunctional biosynthetic peptidoglycan transglycosylase [Sinobacterium caligoides]